jgi:hypothetical protein
MAAAFTADDRIGRSFWLDLGEGDGDLYGCLPGARYEIVEHDGDWRTIYQAIVDVHAEAERAQAAGEPPVMFVVDQIGALWDMLSEWAANRAMTSASNKKALALDPNANIDVGVNYWTPATKRWRQAMTKLMTFSGVVLLLSRGRETVLIGPGGNPVANRKDYRVDGHRTLTNDVSVQIRLAHGVAPQIVGGRSGLVDMRPGAFRERAMPDFSLGWLVFDALGYQPDSARVRVGVELRAGSDSPQSERYAEIETAIRQAATLDELRSEFVSIAPAEACGEITEGQSAALQALARERRQEFVSARASAAAADDSPDRQPVGAAA